MANEKSFDSRILQSTNLLLIIFVEFSFKFIHKMELIIKNFNEHLEMNFFFYFISLPFSK